MDRVEIASLERELRAHRAALFREIAGAESGLQEIAEERESEFEERAQQDRMARLFAKLDVRGQHAIEQIDAALARVADGTYGTCRGCGEQIPLARLRALPATPVCLACAQMREHPAGAEVEMLPPRPAILPADLNLLTDRELEATVRELVHQDGGVDMEELRIVCRHGVIYMDGVLPSEPEHQVVLQLLSDVLGFREIVDRVQVHEILWEREERSRPQIPEVAVARAEPPETDDIVRAGEEGVAYVPPDAPLPEEE